MYAVFISADISSFWPDTRALAIDVNSGKYFYLYVQESIYSSLLICALIRVVTDVHS